MEEKKIHLEELPEEAQEKEDLRGESLNDRVRVLSPGMMVAKRFFRSKLSVVGLFMLVALFLISFIGPVFSPWAKGGQPITDYNNVKDIIVTEKIEYITEDGELVEAYEITVETPKFNRRGDLTWKHWLGTDDNGKDLFTNLMLGGRISLTIGFVVIILETLIGVVLGGFAGYFGGWVDTLIMRIVDI